MTRNGMFCLLGLVVCFALPDGLKAGPSTLPSGGPIDPTGAEAIPAEITRVTAGLDCFVSTRAEKDFGLVPIPRDFFDPGSEEFDQLVELIGVPIDPDNLGNTDTIVERMEDAVFTGGWGTSVLVDVRMNTLSLEGAEPITVIVNGDEQLWDVEVGLDPGHEDCIGTMWLKRTSSQGGTFSTSLCVPAKFTFVRQSDEAVRELIEEVSFPEGEESPWVGSVGDSSIVACDDDFVPCVSSGLQPLTKAVRGGGRGAVVGGAVVVDGLDFTDFWDWYWDWWWTHVHVHQAPDHVHETEPADYDPDPEPG